MFVIILLVYSCIVVLIMIYLCAKFHPDPFRRSGVIKKQTSIHPTFAFIIQVISNPLQGFPSYPVIQYQGSYRNEQPILVQPSDFTSYPHLHLIQNQVSPYENIPISYNDLENILRNRINSGIDTNYDQNGGQILRYVTPTDIYVPNAVNNYNIVPVEYIDKNSKTKHCNKITSKCKTRVNGKASATIKNNDQKKSSKCRKRKNTSRNISGKDHENKEQCSSDKEINQDIKDGMIKRSRNKDEKVCKKKKTRNKPHSTDLSKEKEISKNNEKLTKDNIYILENSQNTNKNLNKIDKVLKSINSEDNKRVQNDKNKSNNCRKVTKKDNSCDLGQILELDDYFDIKEDCAEHDTRCTRNYKEESIQKCQQQYHIPSDYTNNMANYMVSNPQLFNTNGYFPYNFDYLFNMQQFANENSNPSQNKPKNFRRTSRRKNQRKADKLNCDRNKQDSKQSGGGNKNEKLSSTIAVVATDHEPTSTTTATINGTKIVITSHQDVLDINKVERDITLGMHDDSKGSAPNDRVDRNLEDPSPVYDDYYPTFHSDNIYTSKEEFDWDYFNDRNYYSSTDMSELGRERRRYDNTNDIPITQPDNIINPNYLKPLTRVIINTNGKVKEPFRINSKEEKDSIKPKTSSEEIQFRTPPSLDFPDFKTVMINKETHTPTGDKAINKYENSKMSTYSNTKKADSNETRNKIVDQNDVETVFGHSKVVKYGAPPNKGEIGLDITGSDHSFIEDNLSHSTDEKITIIIAKSLPYPIT